MFRFFAAAILCLPALCLTPAAAQDSGLTVDQIVQKHIEAVGGAGKIKAIRNLKLTGKAQVMGGQIDAPITLIVKRPNSMRLDMTVQGKTLVQAFDGETAWTINPFQGAAEPQKSSDEDTKAARDESDFIEGSLFDYKAKGNTVELIGKEDVEGSPAYKLKVTKKSGNVQYIYLGVQSFLGVKVTRRRKQMGQDVDIDSMPGSYKPVNGVMVPFTMDQKVAGRPVMQLTVEQAEANVPLDDAIFRMPQKAKDETPPKPNAAANP